ncbi:MAG: N-6 DNA methylase [Sulfurimonas sp.]|nr:N-6 DNA methylase [Sulfurimonas sp.]
MLNQKLKGLINQLWDKFWSGGISNPLTAIEQITYLIFMKRIEELDNKRVADAQFTEGEFTSLFDGVYKYNPDDENEKGIEKEKLKFSYIKQLPSDERISHINQYVFPFLKELNGKNSHFTKHMKNAVFIIPSAPLLHEAIEKIEEIFEEIEKDSIENGQAFQDIQGDVYEMLLSEIATAGKNGQFRTPRHIIKLLTELVKPKYGDRIADPACGTGGFLLGAYQYIVSTLDIDKQYLVEDEDGFERTTTSAMLTQERKDVLDSSLRGYDIDVTMVRLGLMNLMMHGIDDPNIDYTDTLSKGFQKFSGEQNSYDVILANPPFTGNLNSGEIDDTLSLSTTKTELLFIERIYSMLRGGGTAGVIIPQGVLFGSSKAFKDARKLMIEDSQLQAVIAMPSGVFKPYAGVATAIIVFTKSGDTDDVFFYNMANDGYSLDDKRKRHLDKSTDLQDIIAKYRDKTNIENDRKNSYFLVSKKDIVENDYDLSFNTYQEEVYEEIEYDEPSVIIKKLTTLEESIQSELSSIKSMYE